MLHLLPATQSASLRQYPPYWQILFGLNVGEGTGLKDGGMGIIVGLTGLEDGVLVVGLFVREIGLVEGTIGLSEGLIVGVKVGLLTGLATGAVG